MSEIVKPIVLDETAQAIKTELHNIAANMGVVDAVRYSESQSLTAAQKAQARQNIDAVKKPATDGTNGQILTTDGTGGTSWTTLQDAPVLSVNGYIGNVNLDAEDVGAEESGAVSGHNSDSTAHSTLFAAKADASHTTDENAHSTLFADKADASHTSDANAHSSLFAAKADASHTHTTDDITDMPTAFGSVIIDNITYVLRMGTAGAAGYVTFKAVN